MSWIRNIKSSIGEYLFRKEIKFTQRERAVVGFGDAKKIGILYDATTKSNYELVKEYLRKIRNQQKEVKALGFIDSKKFPPDQFVKLGMDFFTREHLNWYLTPDSRVTDNFVNENFDILISLNIEKCFPLQYISAFSKAKYRVGNYGNGSEVFYDLMINLKPEDDLKNFIEQVDYYINLINTK